MEEGVSPPVAGVVLSDHHDPGESRLPSRALIVARDEGGWIVQEAKVEAPDDGLRKKAIKHFLNS